MIGEAMTAIAQDAQRQSLLFDYGVASAEDVIHWADSKIVEMDSPPDALIELSTTAPDHTADIISLLHRLREGADFWLAFRLVLGQLHDYVTNHPARAESIANHLFLTACAFYPAEIPADLQFLYRFDDAFSLARTGTYGEPDTVYKEFISELGRYKQKAYQSAGANLAPR